MRDSLAERFEGTIYISGPMAGYADLNFPSFNAAQRLLETEGWTVINPAKAPVNKDDDGNEDMQAIIKWDIEQILALDPEKDAMFMLVDWPRSTGACVEHDLAVWKGLKVFTQGKEK